MAMTNEVGKLTGSLQVITIDVKRAAELPITLTVLLPVMMVPSFDGGLTKTPPIGMCTGIPLTWVPVFAAGMPLIMTGPVNGPPKMPEMAAPMAMPTASPRGSNTMPMNG
jgi:hypothetical protein